MSASACSGSPPTRALRSMSAGDGRRMRRRIDRDGDDLPADRRRSPRGQRLQVGQHRPGQRQECDHGHTALMRSAARAPLSRGLRVALQSPLRAAREPRPARPNRGGDQAAAASFDHRDPTISSGSVGVIRFPFVSAHWQRGVV
jgi:hypothetical protein